MVYIDDIYADEVLDSRGNPTVRATVVLSDETVANAVVPSGASTGSKEALELRDGGERYLGKGVLKAVENVNVEIADELIGLSPFNQAEIDNAMKVLDGTDSYGKLGANAVLGVSMAVARASADSLGIPLYRYLGGSNALTLSTPMFNILNGGSHADNNVDFQEYMIIPNGFDSFARALQAASETYHHLKKILSDKGLSTSLGDEGGFAPNLKNNEEPLELIVQAIKNAGYEPRKQISIVIDAASSEFLTPQGYKLGSENRTLSNSELVDYYDELIAKYPIISIEDGLAEDDWDGWKIMTDKLGKKIQLIGDDIFVTNKKILARGIKEGIANSVLIKLNQIGTVSETMQTIRLAQRNNYACVV
ncbi:MAG: phosphopyruvate hydratase, partial [Hydrogenimonas sp.]|nr:phosphopyruvate hydratase [Hydrogenimonas sp.]